MISHKYKCIFIHIPRTGGTYVEKMISAHFLLGKDRNFWDLPKEEKHLIASQAKKKIFEILERLFKIYNNKRTNIKNEINDALLKKLFWRKKYS